MMPKVSVIVPVYRVREYIERCSISLFEQTLEDMEFIFVNDNTDDDSMIVLHDVILRYPSRHSQIKIVNHKINKGLPQARRTGIDLATGEYFAHCDSDDWVDLEMYETLYNKAIKDGSDLVVCDYLNVYEDYSRHSDPAYDYEYLQSLLLCKCTGSLCNKLTRKELFLRNDFVYPKASFCEDFVCSVQLALYSSKVSYIPKPLYKYCHRGGSIVTSSDALSIKKRISDNLENHKLVEQIIVKNGLAEKYKSELIALRLIVKNSIRLYMPRKGFYKLWLKTYPDLNLNVFKSKHITWRSRFVYYVTLVGLYPFIKKIVRNA